MYQAYAGKAQVSMSVYSAGELGYLDGFHGLQVCVRDGWSNDECDVYMDAYWEAQVPRTPNAS